MYFLIIFCLKIVTNMILIRINISLLYVLKKVGYSYYQKYANRMCY